jgi:hypothetical protein
MAVANTGPAAHGAATYADEDLTAWQSRMREDSSRRLRELIPPDVKLATEPEYVIATDFPTDGILEAATTHRAELSVMGANQTRSAFGRTRAVGRHSWVLCEATCPVLTVKS